MKAPYTFMTRFGHDRAYEDRLKAESGVCHVCGKRPVCWVVEDLGWCRIHMSDAKAHAVARCRLPHD